MSRLPVPPPGELQAPFPAGVGRPVSSTTVSGNPSVKSAAIEPLFIANELVQTVACLAQLPDPGVIAISICKILGPAPSAAWDIMPPSFKDVAKATREDKVMGKLLSAVHSGELNKDNPDLKSFMSLF